jgi:hypothetical protein
VLPVIDVADETGAVADVPPLLDEPPNVLVSDEAEPVVATEDSALDEPVP